MGLTQISYHFWVKRFRNQKMLINIREMRYQNFRKINPSKRNGLNLNRVVEQRIKSKYFVCIKLRIWLPTIRPTHRFCLLMIYQDTDL